jgi:urease accessory protein
MTVLATLLADARTPTGSYAHSGGLEQAVAEGMVASEVADFIQARLQTVGLCEAALTAAATRACELEALTTLDLEAAARTPAEPIRAAAARLGRGVLRTARVWWPDAALLREYASASGLTPRPVALGVVAGTAGLEPLEASRVSLYDDAATVAAAASKLLSLDAAAATGWIVALASEIDGLAVQATEASALPARELPSTSTPLLDRRGLTHAAAERRLFAT